MVVFSHHQCKGSVTGLCSSQLTLAVPIKCSTKLDSDKCRHLLMKAFCLYMKSELATESDRNNKEDACGNEAVHCQ